MLDLWTPARTLADQLTAAGVRATTDPSDTHPPVALVQPSTVRLIAGGCADLELTVTLVTGGLDHTQLAWLWQTGLPTVLVTLPADQIVTDQTADGLPAVTLTTTVTVQE